MGNPAGGFFFNPFDFAVKGIANTSVLEFGGKLLALYEVWSCLIYTHPICAWRVCTSFAGSKASGCLVCSAEQLLNTLRCKAMTSSCGLQYHFKWAELGSLSSGTVHIHTLFFCLMLLPCSASCPALCVKAVWSFMIATVQI